MPQLNKGGKWVFGWVVVSKNHQIQIPQESYSEYGFQSGETVYFTRGSRRSGGFGVGRQDIFLRNERIRSRIILPEIMGENMRINIPPEINIRPGERLLAVRGSNYALGFLQFGPIYDEALNHSGIGVFVS